MSSRPVLVLAPAAALLHKPVGFRTAACAFDCFSTVLVLLHKRVGCEAACFCSVASLPNQCWCCCIGWLCFGQLHVLSIASQPVLVLPHKPVGFRTAACAFHCFSTVLVLLHKPVECSILFLVCISALPLLVLLHKRVGLRAAFCAFWHVFQPVLVLLHKPVGFRTAACAFHCFSTSAGAAA
jgi:hypothetical protein